MSVAEILGVFKKVAQTTFAPSVQEEATGETNNDTTGEKADFSPVFLTVEIVRPIAYSDISSYFVAVLSNFGSAEYTPSIAFPKRIASASISAARSAAPVSVVKNGFPVPHANITTLFLVKCFIAFLFINGSAFLYV